MLKNEYQGKDFIELFNPALKDPLVNCKTAGANGIQKFYEKDVKGSVYQLDGIPTVTRITIPKDTKQGLSLIQRCIVFQLEIRHGQDFSMEITASDLNQNKRNLLFSTSHKELNVQPLSARIPLKCINRGQWTNLVVDVAAFISELWRNQTFKIVESITVCANCKLRKIFSLKNLPNPEIDIFLNKSVPTHVHAIIYGLLADNIINQVDFPLGTDYKLQILSINDIKSSDTVELSRMNSFDSSLSDSNSKLKNSYKIAFGTKVSAQNQQQISNQSKNKSNQTSDRSKPEINSDSLMVSTRRKSDSDNSAREKATDSDNLENSNSQQKQKQKSKRINENNRTKSANNINNNSDNSKNDLNGSNSANNKSSNQIGNSTENKRIPHPPPPSTRPTSSARKPRILVKNQQVKPNANTNEKPIDSIKNNNENQQNNNSINKTSNNSSNNNLNESITDIIQALKLNEKNDKTNKVPQSTSILLPKPPTSNNLSENSNVYSFSSKPKVVDVEMRKNQTQVQKTYDFRKYISNSPQKPDSNNDKKEIKANENVNDNNSFSIFTLLNHKPTIPVGVANGQPNFEVTDSFEANLLQQFKAEMDEVPKKRATEPQIKPIQKSPNSPIILDNSSHSNENTSDRLFNYEVLTNSNDTDSTTKRLALRKLKAQQHNYQDEMNTASTDRQNIRSTIRDYSIMRSMYHTNSPMLRNPINEEIRYDVDSQATDNVSENSEDELNLVYDEKLDCYYDPKTSTYYDLNK